MNAIERAEQSLKDNPLNPCADLIRDLLSELKEKEEWIANLLKFNADLEAERNDVEKATAEDCAEIAINRQVTISVMPSVKECISYNKGCRDSADAIRTKYNL